eukprot:scaffold23234_cov28-Tisochrysis_lutea.AAC.2
MTRPQTVGTVNSTSRYILHPRSSTMRLEPRTEVSAPKTASTLRNSSCHLAVAPATRANSS